MSLLNIISILMLVVVIGCSRMQFNPELSKIELTKNVIITGIWAKNKSSRLKFYFKIMNDSTNRIVIPFSSILCRTEDAEGYVRNEVSYDSIDKTVISSSNQGSLSVDNTTASFTSNGYTVVNNYKGNTIIDSIDVRPYSTARMQISCILDDKNVSKEKDRLEFIIKRHFVISNEQTFVSSQEKILKLVEKIDE